MDSSSQGKSSRKNSAESQKNEKLDIQLIDFAREYPALYDISLPEYRNKDLKEKIWAKFAADHNLTIEDTKRKWLNLRNGYRQARSRSNSRAIWKHLDRMKYLDDDATDESETNTITNREQSDITISYQDITTDSQDMVEMLDPNTIAQYSNEKQCSINDNRSDKKSIFKKTNRKRSFDTSSMSSHISNDSKWLDSGREKDLMFNQALNNLLTNGQNNDKLGQLFLDDSKNPLTLFFKSLRSDLEKFNEKQLRKFKRHVLSLIDEILDENLNE